MSTVNLRLRELELQEQMIEKWNGVLPVYQGGNAPFYNFNPDAASN
jgi:hypothetical protein